MNGRLELEKVHCNWEDDKKSPKLGKKKSFQQK